MDRMTPGSEQKPKPKQPPKAVIGLVILAALAILGSKAVEEGWFLSREPLDLSNAPVLLFFNRHKGCECELVVYEAAEEQIKGWSEESRSGLQIIPIDLDRRLDLGKQFNIVRAPALLLVDRDGAIILAQKESISDTAPLDLIPFEKVGREVTHGK